MMRMMSNIGQRLYTSTCPMIKQHCYTRRMNCTLESDERKSRLPVADDIIAKTQKCYRKMANIRAPAHIHDKATLHGDLIKHNNTSSTLYK